MHFFGLSFFVVFSLLCNDTYAIDVVDYLARFFGKYDYSKIVYFVVECDSSSIGNTVDVVRQLNSKWPGEEMNVITVAYNQHTGMRSTIYTNNLRQLQEGLERYSCNASTTYNHEPPKVENFVSILSTMVNTLHYNETIFLFTINERSGFWPDDLQRKLEDKNIQINAVVSESSRGDDQFVNTIRNIGGRIFPYRGQDSRGWSPSHSNPGFSSSGYTYKIKAIRKENLMENSRIVFPLAEGTASIILTIEGALQKCLLISPSGVMINLLPIQTRNNVPFERSSMMEPVLNLKMPIYESPAEWILSTNGIGYNATMTMMIKTRMGMNEHMYPQTQNDNYNGIYSNNMKENSLSPYRPYLDPNKDQWTGSSQSNSLGKDQWTDNMQQHSRSKDQDQWTDNTQHSRSKDQNQWTDNTQHSRSKDQNQWTDNTQHSRSKDQWTSDSQSNPPSMIKRYDAEGPPLYDAEKSNRIRSTENFQLNSGSIKRYDNEGPPSYNFQNPARAGIPPPPGSPNEQSINLISTIIDVDVVSTFYVYPGEEARIVFNVRNNKEIPSKYSFYCHYMDQPCSIYPVYASLRPQEHIQVVLTVRTTGSDGSSSIVGLISVSETIIDRKVYLFTGRPRSDRTKPDIDYEYNGNCDDANTGNTCLRKRWSANVVARDKEAGLLNFWSEPQGLIYTSEFIVGTREHVPARYTASCCNPKVDILASDLQGNTYRITLDVEHQFLSAIEIIAIVLGVIILILLICAIIYGFMKWRKRNSDTSFLKRSPTQRYNADQ